MKWLKKHGDTVLLFTMLIVGVGVFAYPSVADYYNSWIQRRAISSYAETVVQMDTDAYKEIREDAESYNEALAKTGFQWSMDEESTAQYEQQLKVDASLSMGYIEIPKLGEKLVIYHGTSEEVLRTGVGHMQGSSLPIGGETSHCVLSGHRGLPSAKLFSDLDKMEEGDTFLLHVLDMTLTYEVDQIRVVEPADLSQIVMEQGKDYCTLVTCTPYGVNTHRLLVRGHRIDNAQGDAAVTADAIQLEPLYIAPFIAAPILFVLLLLLLFSTGKGKKGKRMEKGGKER